MCNAKTALNLDARFVAISIEMCIHTDGLVQCVGTYSLSLWTAPIGPFMILSWQLDGAGWLISIISFMILILAARWHIWAGSQLVLVSIQRGEKVALSYQIQ